MTTRIGARPILAGLMGAALAAACGGGSDESPTAGAGASNAAATAGGAAGMVGDYGGDECLYDKLTFTESGGVYATMFGTDQAGQYRIDGERIVVTVGPQSLVFTKNGDNLEANLLGDRMVCGPLAADGRQAASAAGREVYEATTDEGRITLELGAQGMARMTMTGAELPGSMTFDVRYEMSGNSVTIEMPGDESVEFVRNGRDLVSTMDGETVRFIRR
jgi:hypothetical protein